MTQEEELVIDPAFFGELKRHLARVSRVEVQLKRGSHQNEMTKYRYDVRLEVGGVSEEVGVGRKEEWKYGGESMEEIKRRVEQSEAEEVRVRGVKNKRVAGEVRAVKELGMDEWEGTAGELREVVQKWKVEALDPELFWSMGEKMRLEVQITWSKEMKDCYDVIIRRKPAKTGVRTTNLAATEEREQKREGWWKDYANDPLRGLQRRMLVTEVREYLKENLPEYMVPHMIVEMDNFPLTSTGKVDREALPEPEEESGKMARDFEAPKSRVEEIIADIWQRVLGVEQVGINENFFDIGGDSLKAVQVISQLRKALDTEITIISLFEKTTISAMAAMLKAKGSQEAWNQKSASSRKRGEKRKVRIKKRMHRSQKDVEPDPEL
jgi:acyl carrier protein